MSISSFIKGRSSPVCLLGYPVSHSISPQIHNYAFERLKLPFVYIPMAVSPRNLHSAVFSLRNCAFAGANVTIPHKQEVVHYCDQLSDLSKLTGTVNTLYFDNGQLCGTTTDYTGFKRAIESIGSTLSDSHVVILGNGGIARTLAAAIAWESRVASLTIAGRNIDKIERLASTITATANFTVNAVAFDNKAFDIVMNKCMFLVNCTSVGMYPDIGTSPINADYLHSGIVVFDTIYNPLETQLLKDARKAGCVTQNGLRMLLFQALASSKLWTGTDIPEELFSINELESLIGT